MTWSRLLGQTLRQGKAGSGVPAALRNNAISGPKRFLHSSRVAAAQDNTSGKESDSHYHPQHQHSPENLEPETFGKEFDNRIPSNKAKPKLSDAYQHSGADPNHPKKRAWQDLNEEERRKFEQEQDEVRRHNEDMDRRYDRAYTQLTEDNKVESLDEMEEQRFKGE
ncbi:hypothetical protein FQN57_007290 [Myotisia sp. PD_48]|nr:hypothetical protein FQN57_007290 [Myotisia sp. PD_48]